MNSVYLLGNSGANAELRYTQGGLPILSLSIATSKKVKDEKRTTWHRVSVLGKSAEIVAPLIQKGTMVFIEGELQTREWTDKDGNKKSITEVLAKIIYPVVKAGVTDKIEKPTETQFEENDMPF